jgi:hypothetical protein
MIRKADGLKIIDEVPPAPQPQTVVRIETISDNTGRQDKKNIVAEPTGSVSEKFSKHQTPHDTQQSEITEKAPSREQEEPLPEQEKTNQPGLTFTDSYPDKSPEPAPEAKNNNNETENPRKENIDKTADTNTPEHPHGDEIKKSETPPTPAQSLKTESSEKDKVIKKFTHSPGEAWHLLMKDMENQLKDQTLKTYMAEGFPVSFENNTLTIAFDDEFSPEHIEIIKKRLNLINKRFSVISGLKNPEIKITHREGAHDFHEQHSKYSDITELKERVQSNSFVKNVMEVFNGKIVDIHG